MLTKYTYSYRIVEQYLALLFRVIEPIDLLGT